MFGSTPGWLRIHVNSWMSPVLLEQSTRSLFSQSALKVNNQLMLKLLYYCVNKIITPRTSAGVKQSVVCLSVVVITTKIARSRDLGIWGACKHNQLVEAVKNWLECASNHLSRSMNVTNSVFLLAIVVTPIDSAHLHCTSTVQSMCFLLMRTTGLVEIVNITGLSEMV